LIVPAGAAEQNSITTLAEKERPQHGLRGVDL
jgi:hypothetical protein